MTLAELDRRISAAKVRDFRLSRPDGAWLATARTKQGSGFLVGEGKTATEAIEKLLPQLEAVVKVEREAK